MDALTAKIEAILFAAGRPLAMTQLAKLVGSTAEQTKPAVEALAKEYMATNRGFALMLQDNKVQLVSNPAQGKLVEAFIKEEFTGPLSRAALETLAIIAYRGPIAKPEIDTIRGVNSAVMLRTLLVRGLVERKKSRTDARGFEYSLSFEFMRHLGVTQLPELPQYEALHTNQVMERFAKSASAASIEAELP